VAGIRLSSSPRSPQVDLERFAIQVEDNGCGVAYADLQKLGLPHHTSKASSWEEVRLAATFGFRGEALASLQQVGVLTITTRDPETGLTWSKVMSHGRTLSLRAAAASRPSRGTTIQLQDVFGQLPVRRKCMVASAELQKIRLRVAGIALAKTSVGITLTDAAHGAVLLRTSGAMASEGQPPDTRFVFGKIFGAAKAKAMYRLEKKSGAAGGMEVRGFISTAPHYTPEFEVGWGVGE
jgi:DNA mismatch repair ATPase MutL